MIELPKDEFCSWHGESWKSLINPTGVCNAFTHGAGVDDKEKAWWEEKGYHREPLYTADQLRTYGDQRAAEAREQMREELLPLLKRMANNYGWVEHTPEYPNDDGWRSVRHDGLMMIRKLEKMK